MDAVWLVVRAIGWVLSPLYYVTFYPLDLYLTRRNQRKLATEVRAWMAFLFTEYGAEILPIRNTWRPRSLASVTLRVEPLLLRICRGRDELAVDVMSARGGDAWHGVSVYVRPEDRGVRYFRTLDDLAAYLKRNMPEILAGFATSEGRSS